VKKLLKRLTMLLFGPPVRYVISQIDLLGATNRRLAIMEEMIQDAYPPCVVINPNSQAEIDRIKRIFSLPASLSMNISKNDLMFKNYLANGLSTPDSFKAYLVRTVHFMDIVEKVAQARWGGGGALSQATPFLDFASGYGAFERLLIYKIPASQIYTSDIKTQGVDFQVEQFGVNGIYSSFVPEAFSPALPFRFIYVASLFSHLPEDLFKRWLARLWHLTDENGVFVFTIHNTKLIGDGPDFVYSDGSEDSVQRAVSDSITESANYGLTYISDAKLAQWLGEIGVEQAQYGQYPRAFCGLQDIIVVSRERHVFDSRLTFGEFDSTRY
jgi:hypothetical protein